LSSEQLQVRRVERVLRVLIADGSPLESAGLRAALEDADMSVVAVCPDIRCGALAARVARPDAMIVAAVLLAPGDHDAEREAVDRLCAACPGAELIVLLEDADMELMLRLVRLGVHGILLGTSDPQRLPSAIAGVVAHETAFPRALVRALADEVCHSARLRHPPGACSGLTTREIEILGALGEGVSATDVAERLEIRHATVRRHVANAMHTLGVSDRASAIACVRSARDSRRAA
jgi:DNA-binding NarL/FixJ family response regulator